MLVHHTLRPSESVGGLRDDVQVDGVRHGTASGYQTNKCRCDICVGWKRAKDRAYYEANREKVKARVEARRVADPERVAAERAASEERNAEKIKERNRAYAEAHRAEAVERVRKWRLANPERRREQARKDVARNREAHNRRGREWHERNRERSNANSRAYGQTEAGRAVRKAAHYKRRGLRLRDVDEVTRGYLQAIAGDPCAYCGGPAGTVDHKQPLSRGGSNEWWNLTAACRSCNSRKHNKTVEEFLMAPSLTTPGLGQLEDTA